MHQKQDLFGFENQGNNYDIYRPTYPKQFIDRLINQNYQSYLDIATGTGQVFFEFPQKGIKVGNDVSEKQFKVFTEKLAKLNDPNSHAIFGDAFEIRSLLANKQLDQQFDLITIGQALHWFDVPKLLPYLKSMLTEQGTLAILSYIAEEVYLDTEDEIDRKSVSVYQSTFYKEVKPYFDCDRDNLSQGYPLYEFNKYFDTVEQYTDDVYTPQSLDQVIAYLRTYSAYNQYLATGKPDPIINFKEALLKGYNRPGLPNLLLHTRFYLHLLK